MELPWVVGRKSPNPEGVPPIAPLNTHRMVQCSMFAFLSRRDYALQPRVATKELPWVGGRKSPNPGGVPPIASLNTYPGFSFRGQRGMNWHSADEKENKKSGRGGAGAARRIEGREGTGTEAHARPAAREHTGPGDPSNITLRIRHIQAPTLSDRFYRPSPAIIQTA
jgi:hypothetical protein